MSVGRPAGGRRKRLRSGVTGGATPPPGPATPSPEPATAQPGAGPGLGCVAVPGSDPAAGESDADRAITMMYQAHYRGLVRLAVLLAGDLGTAEEVVQDAFAAMHRDWDRLQDQAAALSFLHRCVVTGSRSLAPGPVLAVAPRYPVPAGGPAPVAGPGQPDERVLQAVPLQAAWPADATATAIPVPAMPVPARPVPAMTVPARESRAPEAAQPGRERPAGTELATGPAEATQPSGVIPALQRLPGPQREALALRLYLDLPDEQIADAMQVSRAAARGHVNSGLAALRGVA
jgi:DNA-directed RNA polymerase specialized sigma24 family protein